MGLVSGSLTESDLAERWPGRRLTELEVKLAGAGVIGPTRGTSVDLQTALEQSGQLVGQEERRWSSRDRS